MSRGTSRGAHDRRDPLIGLFLIIELTGFVGLILLIAAAWRACR